MTMTCYLHNLKEISLERLSSESRLKYEYSVLRLQNDGSRVTIFPTDDQLRRLADLLNAHLDEIA